MKFVIIQPLICKNMKQFHLLFSLFLVLSINLYSQGNSNEAFNDQIAKAEKAIIDRDLIKVKTILSSQPLKSKQQNAKVKMLNTKVSVLEAILNGQSNLSSQKWDDAISNADNGLSIIAQNSAIFIGNEKSELESIKKDAENGKKGIVNNNSSGPNNSSSIKLDDLGDPIDYKSGYDQMMTTYQNEKKAPNVEFERNKDTLFSEDQNRQKIIKQNLIENEKRIDSAQVKMNNNRENNIKNVSENYKDYLNERDKVIDSKNEQKNEVATYVSESTSKQDSLVRVITDANENRNQDIKRNIDSSIRKTNQALQEIEKENQRRDQSLNKNIKNNDSLSRVVNISLQNQQKENADYVADNTKKMDEYRQAEPEKSKGSGMLNSKGIPYQKGITQGVFAKGEKGKTRMLVTRRVKVDENNNVDVYIRNEAPNTVTTYTKNGNTINEYTWNVESGNVTFFE